MADPPKLPTGMDWKAVTPEDSPKTPLDTFADPKLVDLATTKLRVGDPAYDFKSRIYDYSDGIERDTGRLFHLATATKEKPVALIFGSYT